MILHEATDPTFRIRLSGQTLSDCDSSCQVLSSRKHLKRRHSSFLNSWLLAGSEASDCTYRRKSSRLSPERRYHIIRWQSSFFTSEEATSQGGCLQRSVQNNSKTRVWKISLSNHSCWNHHRSKCFLLNFKEYRDKLLLHFYSWNRSAAIKKKSIMKMEWRKVDRFLWSLALISFFRPKTSLR